MLTKVETEVNLHDVIKQAALMRAQRLDDQAVRLNRFANSLPSDVPADLAIAFLAQIISGEVENKP